MFSKLVSISENEDLQEITGLTTIQMQIVLFLLYHDESEFGFNELLKKLNEFGFKIYESTFDRSLRKLKEKQLIFWDRALKLRYDRRSKISLIVEELDHKLEVRKKVDEVYYELERVKSDAEEMSEKDINDILIDIVKNQAGGSLYLRLLLAEEVITEAMFNIGFMWFNIASEMIQEAYIEVLKKRGKKSIIEVLHHFLQSGIELY